MCKQTVTVLGAGLAGCEAAWTLANQGIAVTLYEQKPKQFSPAHSYSGFAELVCSNSLKAARLDSAAGLLKEEMRMLGSLTMQAAAQTSVGAGGALAVDRKAFSDYITQKIKCHPAITVIEQEVTHIPDGYVIVATGPLTSDKLAQIIMQTVGNQSLSFFDAAAPIVTADSIDMQKAFWGARYQKGDDDYINCPMNQSEYQAFYQALITAESAPLKEIDKRDFCVYEGCMPIEVMAKRGEDTIRFGPLKPVGICDPKTGNRPWAVVQLRKENAQGSMLNLVGFQTNLKFGEQKRVFSMIPGLEHAEFVRYGVMHRNTFLNSPQVLDRFFRLRSDPRIAFAGQITGVEGYIESAASGIYTALNLARQLKGEPMLCLPKHTMIGALADYISDSTVEHFQPMGCNMGLLPPLTQTVRDKKQRYLLLAERSVQTVAQLLNAKG